MTRIVKFHEAILEATQVMMRKDEDVLVVGLGAPDPKGIFGTTKGLQEEFGSNRVQDMPCSENAMTGIGIGLSVMGMRPIMTHQRADFFYLALDQFINNASKWHYMFGGAMKVPLVIRLIVGRGWGQGLQHSQTLHSLLAHIPGLKILVPSTPYDAKGLLISAVEDNNPVVIFEHRWLYNTNGDVPEGHYSVPIGKARVLTKGSDLTLITISHMTIEGKKAVHSLKEQGISVEHIDVRSIKPFDEETILASVAKTGRVMVVDPDWKTLSFASEIITVITENLFSKLKSPPQRITYPDSLAATSWSLANHFYPGSEEICARVLELFDQKEKSVKILQKLLKLRESCPCDVPDSTFTGPF